MPESPLTQTAEADQPSRGDRGTTSDARVAANGPPAEARASLPTALPICPYLLVPGASWRAARPLREHRCTAVTPLDGPSMETQRVLCLVAGHVGCPRFQAVDAERRSHWPGQAEDLVAFEARVARRVPRAIPVALDRPSAMVGPLSLLGGSRRLARLALATVMILAAVLLLAARFAGGGSDGGSVPPSPSATASVARPSPSSRPSRTVVVSPSPAAPGSPSP